MRDFCKLGEPKLESKRADFGVKTQALLRFNSSSIDEQLNLD